MKKRFQLRKLMALLCILALLVCALPMSVSADLNLSDDFNRTIAEINSTNYSTAEFSDALQFGNFSMDTTVTSASGLGKDDDDTFIQITSPAVAGSFSMVQKTGTDLQLENGKYLVQSMQFYPNNAAQRFALYAKANNSWQIILSVTPWGYIIPAGNENFAFTYSAGWYNIVVVYQFGSIDYDIYVNGARINPGAAHTAQFSSALSVYNSTEINIAVSTNDISSYNCAPNICFDNFAIYETDTPSVGLVSIKDSFNRSFETITSANKDSVVFSDALRFGIFPNATVSSASGLGKQAGDRFAHISVSETENTGIVFCQKPSNDMSLPTGRYLVQSMQLYPEKIYQRFSIYAKVNSVYYLVAAFNDSGKFIWYDNNVPTVGVDITPQWYMLDLVFQFGSADYDVYLNGRNVGSGTLGSALTTYNFTEFEMKKGWLVGDTADMYIDNFRLYESASVYTPVGMDCSATIEGGNGFVRIENGAIYGFRGMTTQAVLDAVNIPVNASKWILQSDQSTSVTGSEEAIHGMSLYVQGADGMTLIRYPLKTEVEFYDSAAGPDSKLITSIQAGTVRAHAVFHQGQSGYAILALYSGDKIEQVRVSDYVTAADAQQTTDVSLTIDDETSRSIKCFIWEDLSGLRPCTISYPLD